ncbi:MAG TPA: LysR family transcriptional regulator [Ramlibacter sp.]|uniref:LysR family transcriptional regulator n=1 Tax=Ramlibacter sp. TaxID=1917967 RepID=UPI002D7EA987|nr:LysR family transcriptional regulator [Ramlibacter sp.]HET8746747.1 LysR family transcriptional regulator [Ramlibacter sp.]
MDIALARTFLAVAAQGSFVAAARKLHVTQTAVSARVRNLEEQLGACLFQRCKNGVLLTAEGEKFLPHAASLLQAWERALHQMALPPGRAALVVLGCEPSLWDPLLLRWLAWMNAHAPGLAVRTEVASSRVLLEQIAHGTLDVAIVYAPHHRPGLRVEPLLEEKLVLVTTRADAAAPQDSEYVYVDWGREFAEQHHLLHPEWSRPAVSSDFGPLLREYLLASGGAAYLRLGVVRGLLESGRLQRVRGAPEFAYPAYAVYAEDAGPGALQPALEGLRHAAAGYGQEGAPASPGAAAGPRACA